MSVDAQVCIGGEWFDGGLGSYDIVNPATEAVVGNAPQGSVEQSLAATEAAAEAFASWSRTTPEERANLLEKAADLYDARKDEFVPLVQAETGATMRVAKTMQVPQVSARFRRYARGAMESRIIPLEPQVPGTTALAPGGLISGVGHRAPVGVVSCITSYNFPVVNMAGKIGPALAMGNTVVVKPAPQDPLAVIKLVEVMNEAGFPPGVVNVVCGTDIAASEALVSSPFVDMISFTGSTGVGRRIGEVGGGEMKRLLLELGGKGACIVFDDADLKAAIGGISSVWAFHSGQICTAPTRVIVQRGVYDQLVAGLAQAAKYLKVGDPVERDTVVGPVITEVHRDRVEGYVQSARDEGAEIVAGGERPDMERGFYVAPTLIAERQQRDDRRARGDLRSGRRGRAVRRRGRGDRHRQRQRLRPLQLRLQRRHRSGLGGRQATALRQRRHQLAAAQPRGPVRRLQAVRRRSRRRQLRPARLQRDAVHHLARVGRSAALRKILGNLSKKVSEVVGWVLLTFVQRQQRRRRRPGARHAHHPHHRVHPQPSPRQ